MNSPTTFDIDCRLAYQLPQPTSFLFQIHAAQGGDQEVLSESLELTPQVVNRVYRDPLSDQRFLRLQVPPGDFRLQYRAKVRVGPRTRPLQAQEHDIEDIPDEVMHHLLPTRYCESDLLGNAARKLFGDLPRGYQRVQAISDWIREHIDYAIGTTDARTTASHVFMQRAGVCRDFAHLGISFCRALNIPARLAVGYAVFQDPPPDFHAVFEAFIGGAWVLFDPTGMSPVEDLVRIASGRDAKDVAFSTIFGAACMTEMSPGVQLAS